MKNLIRYGLLALVIIIPFVVITPDSFGSWVLFWVIAVVAAAVVEAGYRRMVR